MPALRRLAALLPVLLLATPAVAAGADGQWACRAFGADIAIVGIKDRAYVVAGRDDANGPGTLSPSADDPAAFTVLDGPLGDRLNVLIVRVTTEQGVPRLTLIEKDGDELICAAKT